MEHDFDPVLLSRSRLGIVTVLMTRPGATFSELKDLLGLTQGNLGVHLRKLEEEGYVAVKKEFVKRKPRTTARLTAKGKRSFLAHVKQLEEIAKGGQRPG
ncbi:MAG: winged helix-turn-helix domain-containing protein [Planctomycetota bacterium]